MEGKREGLSEMEDERGEGEVKGKGKKKGGEGWTRVGWGKGGVGILHPTHLVPRVSVSVSERGTKTVSRRLSVPTQRTESPKSSEEPLSSLITEYHKRSPQPSGTTTVQFTLRITQ